MKTILSLATVAITLVFILLFPWSIHAQSGTVTFGVAGDFSEGTEFNKTISSMAAGGLNFAVAVGDFAYGGNPTTWSNSVRTKMGADFPFELIAGNHDDSTIDSYTPILNNKIASISTDSLSKYGKQYYFDYPVSSPLIRVIHLGPNDSPLSYTYTKNSANYNWVSQAIDSARTANIPWVAVAMHKNCITAGVKSCEIGADVFNLFVAKRVNLIFQGHEHNYQRSFPLRNAASHPAEATGCATISTTFNAACVAASAGNTYPKSAGSTLVIVGTGGQSNYANSNTSQNGFFNTRNHNSHGYLKLTVSSAQINAVFSNNTSGGFTDQFTITNDGPNPTVSITQPAATNTPGPTLSGGVCSTRLGDANHDNNITIADYVSWRNSFLSR